MRSNRIPILRRAIQTRSAQIDHADFVVAPPGVAFFESGMLLFRKAIPPYFVISV
jgi:hypothetical protein